MPGQLTFDAPVLPTPADPNVTGSSTAPDSGMKIGPPLQWTSSGIESTKQRDPLSILLSYSSPSYADAAPVSHANPAQMVQSLGMGSRAAQLPKLTLPPSVTPVADFDSPAPGGYQPFLQQVNPAFLPSQPQAPEHAGFTPNAQDIQAGAEKENAISLQPSSANVVPRMVLSAANARLFGVPSALFPGEYQDLQSHMNAGPVLNFASDIVGGGFGGYGAVKQIGGALGAAGVTSPLLNTALSFPLLQLPGEVSNVVRGNETIGEGAENLGLSLVTGAALHWAGAAVESLGLPNVANRAVNAVAQGVVLGAQPIAEAGLQGKPVDWKDVGTQAVTGAAFGAMGGSHESGEVATSEAAHVTRETVENTDWAGMDKKTWAGIPSDVKDQYKAHFESVITEKANQYGVDPNDLRGLIHSENGPLDPTAVSPTGVRGFAQFTRLTARSYGVDRSDPISNIDGAARYLRDLLVKHDGDLTAAIADYKGVKEGGATNADVQKAVNMAEGFRNGSLAYNEAKPAAPVAPETPQAPEAAQTPPPTEKAQADAAQPVQRPQSTEVSEMLAMADSDANQPGSSRPLTDSPEPVYSDTDTNTLGENQPAPYRTTYHKGIDIGDKHTPLAPGKLGGYEDAPVVEYNTTTGNHVGEPLAGIEVDNPNEVESVTGYRPLESQQTDGKYFVPLDYVNRPEGETVDRTENGPVVRQAGEERPAAAPPAETPAQPEASIEDQFAKGRDDFYNAIKEHSPGISDEQFEVAKAVVDSHAQGWAQKNGNADWREYFPQQALSETTNEAPGESALHQPVDIDVWHGTKQAFDAFDDNKINTGEGTQYEGHGHYVTENRDTAEWYADAITNQHDELMEVDAPFYLRETMKSLGADWKNPEDVAKHAKPALERAREWAKNRVKQLEPHYDNSDIDVYEHTFSSSYAYDKLLQGRALDAVKALSRMSPEDAAKEVNRIPRKTVIAGHIKGEFVDRSDRLADEKALRAAVLPEAQKEYVAANKEIPYDVKYPGNWGEFYNQLANDFSPQKASEIMKRAGIDGLKYRGDEGTANYHNYVVFNPDRIDVRGHEFLEQRNANAAKAAVTFREDGKAVLHMLQGHDVSSLFHELGHVWRRELSGADLATAERWAGRVAKDENGNKVGAIKNGVWTRAHEEAFARGFERYLRDGKAPFEALRNVFEKLKGWLGEIYTKLKGSPIDIHISPEMRKVFDRMFGETDGEKNATDNGPEGANERGNIGEHPAGEGSRETASSGGGDSSVGSEAKETPSRSPVAGKSIAGEWNVPGDKVNYVDPNSGKHVNGEVTDIPSNEKYIEVDGKNLLASDVMAGHAELAENKAEIPRTDKEIVAQEEPTTVREATLSYIAKGGKLSYEDAKRDVFGSHLRSGGKNADITLAQKRFLQNGGKRLDQFVAEDIPHLLGRERMTTEEQSDALRDVHDVLGEVQSTKHAAELFAKSYKDQTDFNPPEREPEPASKTSDEVVPGFELPETAHSLMEKEVDKRIADARSEYESAKTARDKKLNELTKRTAGTMKIPDHVTVRTDRPGESETAKDVKDRLQRATDAAMKPLEDRVETARKALLEHEDNREKSIQEVRGQEVSMFDQGGNLESAVVPGLHQLIEQDIVPGARKLAEDVADISKRAQGVFAPATAHDNAERTKQGLHQAMGPENRRTEQDVEKTKDIRSQFNQQSAVNNIKFALRYEEGQAQPPGWQSDAANQLKGLYAESARLQQEAGKETGHTVLPSLRENYQKGAYKYDPALASKVLGQPVTGKQTLATLTGRGSRFLRGSGSQLKEREMTLREHLERGEVPLHDNPVDQYFKAYEREAGPLRIAHNAIGDLIKSGAARVIDGADENAVKQAKRDGMMHPMDPSFSIRTQAQNGTFKEHQVWLQPESYKVIQNHLMSAPALAPLVQTFNLLHNMTTLMGVTHASITSVNFVANRGANALAALAHGELAAAGHAMGDGFYGSKIKQEWLHPGSVDDVSVKEDVKWMEKIGGGVLRAPVDNMAFTRSFTRAVSQKNVLGALPRGMMAGIEQVGGRIMDGLVPLAKLDAWRTEYRSALSKLPANATDFEKTKAVSDAWHNIDDRMGEVWRQRSFMNKNFMFAADLIFPRVNWTLGTYKALSKAVGGSAKFGAETVRAVAGRGGMPQVTSQMAFFPAIFAVAGATNTALQYIMTGKFPWDTNTPVSDMFLGARNGGTLVDGSPARTSVISYARDLVSLYSNPGGTLAAKMTPLVSAATYISNNKDFQGNQVYDPNADKATRAIQIGEMLLKESFKPFALSNYDRLVSEGAPTTAKIGNMIGVTPVAVSVTESEAGKLLQDYYHRESEGHAGRNTAQSIESGKEKQVLEAYRKSSEAGDALSDKLGLRDDRQKAIEKRAQYSPFLSMVHGADLETAAAAYRVATPEQKQMTSIVRVGRGKNQTYEPVTMADIVREKANGTHDKDAGDAILKEFGWERSPEKVKAGPKSAIEKQLDNATNPSVLRRRMGLKGF